MKIANPDKYLDAAPLTCAITDRAEKTGSSYMSTAKIRHSMTTDCYFLLNAKRRLNTVGFRAMRNDAGLVKYKIEYIINKDVDIKLTGGSWLEKPTAKYIRCTGRGTNSREVYVGFRLAKHPPK